MVFWPHSVKNCGTEFKERFYANIITQLGRISHAQCSLKTVLFEPCRFFEFVATFIVMFVRHEAAK